MIVRAPGTDRKNLLGRLNPGCFAVNFNRKPFVIPHHLTDHPLFDLTSLIDLSRKLPAPVWSTIRVICRSVRTPI